VERGAHGTGLLSEAILSAAGAGQYQKRSETRQRKDLVPVFSFKANGLCLAKAQGVGKRIGGPEKMKLWSNMMKRMDGSEI
jgi:hypothetical protein